MCSEHKSPRRAPRALHYREANLNFMGHLHAFMETLRCSDVSNPERKGRCACLRAPYRSPASFWKLYFVLGETNGGSGSTEFGKACGRNWPIEILPSVLEESAEYAQKTSRTHAAYLTHVVHISASSTWHAILVIASVKGRNNAGRRVRPTCGCRATLGRGQSGFRRGPARPVSRGGAAPARPRAAD
jgi:hypothetical protein